MAWVFRDDEMVESSELDEQKINALNDSTRIDILESLGDRPSYPAEIAKNLEIPKQKAYYHFRILEEAELIAKKEEVKKSGGLATIYEPKSFAMHLDLGGEGEKTSFRPMEEAVREFLHPLVENGELDGSIVVGSPDEHGPDQVRGRDGHLAAEIALKLGNYVRRDSPVVKLDTEIFRSEDFDRNMLMLGGILTNNVSRKFNEKFTASFEGESFPYRELKTPENEYTGERVGVIQKTGHPNGENSLFLVAGIQHRGTIAAARAFHDIEQLFEQGETYVVLKGQDMDGDGEIDEYEVLEKG